MSWCHDSILSWCHDVMMACCYDVTAQPSWYLGMGWLAMQTYLPSLSPDGAVKQYLDSEELHHLLVQFWPEIKSKAIGSKSSAGTGSSQTNLWLCPWLYLCVCVCVGPTALAGVQEPAFLSPTHPSSGRFIPVFVLDLETDQPLLLDGTEQVTTSIPPSTPGWSRRRVVHRHFRMSKF